MVLVCRILIVSTGGSWDVGEPLYLELEVTNLAVCQTEDQKDLVAIGRLRSDF
jgi:hypothetical protein